ncbi:helix-turn-helix domain-containing protein [soil metagenome]
MTDRSEQYHAALASPSRRQVLQILLASPIALDAAAVGGQLGLHVTTARFHLDQLTNAGLVQRRVGAENRPGRPRLLYSAAGSIRDEGAREQLIQVLAAALSRDGGPVSEAIQAGRKWADTFAVPAPGDAVPALIDVLDRLGFDPTGDGAAGVIPLRACPFRAAARQHRDVVCAVHEGLIKQLLKDSGHEAKLVPFVEPDLCLVSLKIGGT